MFNKLALLLLGLICGCGSSSLATSTPPSNEGQPVAAAPQNVDELVTETLAGDGAAAADLARELDAYSFEGKPGPDDDALVRALVKLRDAAATGQAIPPSLSPTLLNLFERARAATEKAQHRDMFRVLNAVMVGMADPSWEQAMIDHLNQPIRSAKQEHLKDVINQVYWQITAAEVLGKLKSEKAVIPLIKVVLTPFKANIQVTAVNALIHIGAPAVTGAVKLLNGQDASLKKYAHDEYIRAVEDRDEEVDQRVNAAAGSHYLSSALIIVGNIGTKDCVEPMLTALDKGDTVIKEVIAAELHKLPANPTVEDRFKKVYLATSVTDRIPPDDYAKEALIEAAALFFETDMIEWLLDDSLKLKGDKPDVQGVQASILGVAIKAATKDQWHFVDELVEAALPEIKTTATKYYIRDANEKDERGPFSEADVVKKLMTMEIKQGTAREDKKDAAHKPLQDNQNFAMAMHQAQYINAAKMGKKVLDECGSKVDCYLSKIADPETNTVETAMMSEKAAYMAGLLGGPEVKMKMVELLPRVKNPSAAAIILYVLINKSPNGDPEVVKKLQEYVDAAEQSGDQARIDEVNHYKQIIYRLQARGRQSM